VNNEISDSDDIVTESEFWDWRYKEHGWPEDPDPVLQEIVKELTPGKVLDVGCGTGRNLIWLAKHGWQSTGIDFSEIGLEIARAKAKEQGVTLNLIKLDIVKQNIPDSGYDLVMLFNIHLPAKELEAVIKKCVDALNTNGHLLIVGHHLDNLGHHGPQDPQRLYSESYPINLIPPFMHIKKNEKVVRSAGNDVENVQDVAVVLLAERS
jgi:SAM-dependent methyltransferase